MSQFPSLHPVLLANAEEEINDENVFIVPRDAGFNDKEKLNKAVQEIKQQGVDVIIGPISENEFNEGTVTIKNLKGVKGENNKTFPKSNLIDEIKKLIWKHS